jgi:transposase
VAAQDGARECRIPRVRTASAIGPSCLATTCPTAAALAGRLMLLPVGVDTMLRTLRRRAATDQVPVQVIGIDEWAWRRRQRYGTLICDLERRRVVDLLPDREPATVQAWLSLHPEVSVIARDRAGGYAGAIVDAGTRKRLDLLVTG